nr:transcriptional regulator nrg1 [Quercus suber]
MDDLNHASLYPPIPDATGAIPPSAYPMPMPIVQMPALQQMQAIPASPVHMQPAQQPHRASTSPASEPSRVSAHSAASNAKTQSKKNQYPCPMAKQFGCTDFFTTSGHAARHAKKHTGKKDAFCPECNKAFTRKDNMEQHRRTHQNGRGASRSTTSAPSDDSKVKKSTKQAVKKTVAKAEPQLEAAVEQQLAEQQQQQELLQHQQQQQHRQQLLDSQMIPQVATLPVQQSMLPQGLLDQSMMMPPTCGPYFMGGNGMDAIPVASLPMAMPDLSSRPQLQRSSYGMNSLDYVAPAAPMTISEEGLHYSYPSPGLSNGLNSLALAASEHQRLSQEKALSTSPSFGEETSLRLYITTKCPTFSLLRGRFGDEEQVFAPIDEAGRPHEDASATLPTFSAATSSHPDDLGARDRGIWLARIARGTESWTIPGYASIIADRSCCSESVGPWQCGFLVAQRRRGRMEGTKKSLRGSRL